MNSADVSSFRALSSTIFSAGYLRGIPVELYDYDGNGVLIYEGLAPQGSLTSDAQWLIRRSVYDGNGNLIKKDASQNFQIWDNRATVTYS